MRQSFFIFLCFIYFSISPSYAQLKMGGIGVNAGLESFRLNASDVQKLDVSWVRGDVDYIEFIRGNRIIETFQGIKRLRQAKTKGLNTIFSVRFNLQYLDLSGEADYITAQLNDLDTLMTESLSYSDIISLSIKAEQSSDYAANQSWQTVLIQAAEKIRRYQVSKGLNIPIFVSVPTAWGTPGYQKLSTFLNYVQSQDWISGVEINLQYHTYESAIKRYDYIASMLSHSQKIIITGLFDIKLWQEVKHQTIPADYARTFNIHPQTYLDDYLNEIKLAPLSAEQWYVFINTLDWVNRYHYKMENIINYIRQQPNFYILTFPLYQGAYYRHKPNYQSIPSYFQAIYSNRSINDRTVEGHYKFNPSGYTLFNRLKTVKQSDQSFVQPTLNSE